MIFQKGVLGDDAQKTAPYAGVFVFTGTGIAGSVSVIGVMIASMCGVAQSQPAARQ